MTQKHKFNFRYLGKVIFYVIALLFAIYLVLLASGYKFDFNRKKLIETGSIYLNSNPRDVKIYLDGQLKSNRTPFKLSYLLPGNYEVRIEKDGFKDWQKNLSIKPGLVTSEPEIILFYNQPREEEYSELKNILGLKINESNNELLYYTDKNIYFQKSNAKEYQKSAEFSGGEIVEVFTSSDFTKSLIRKKELGAASETFYFCPDKECREPYDLNLALNLNFDQGALTDDSNYPILLSTQGNLYAIKNDFSKYYIEAGVLDFAFFSNRIYYLQGKEGGVEFASAALDGNDKKVITFEKANESERKNLKLKVDEVKNRLFLIGREKRLFEYNNMRLEEIKTQARDLNFENKNLLLVSNGGEIKLIGKIEPNDEEDSLHNVMRYAQDLLQINWLFQTNHILFVKDNILKTIESRGSNETDLYSFKQGSGGDYQSISKNELIVLDEGRLKKLTICEKGNLVNLW